MGAVDDFARLTVSRASGTTAVDLLVISFASLTASEQEEAFSRIVDLRLQRLAAEGSDAARVLRSLQRVAEEAGRIPSAVDYRRIAPAMRAAGEDDEPIGRVPRQFGASYRRAVEALEMTASDSVRLIQARMDHRRVGKIFKCTEQTLADTLRRCVEHYGRVPQVAEFDWWREHALELARAQGDGAAHLPSPSPYRKRWGSWEGALAHFGYSAEERDARLERP